MVRPSVFQRLDNLGGADDVPLSCPVALEVVELWERLYEDTDAKDVSIIAKGGEAVRVHSVILASLSDPFRAMLASGMVEGQSKTIHLTDYSREELQFFFRLVYTGQVDPADWGGSSHSASRNKGQGKAKCSVVRSRPEVLPSSSSEPELEVEELASIAWSEAKGKRKGKGKGKLKGAAGQLSSGWGSQLLEPSSSSDASVVNGKAKAAFKGKGRRDPPLALLLAGARLSKQYGISGLLHKMVHKIKARLLSTTVDEIAAFGIAQDIGPLRIACVRFAEKSAVVRQLFDSGKLRPEVAFELQAIWPPGSAGRRGQKRKDFF